MKNFDTVRFIIILLAAAAVFIGAALGKTALIPIGCVLLCCAVIGIGRRR